jgi:rare lipoprotein A
LRGAHRSIEAPYGHKTASGDTFHQSNHTAASNKLPLGTDVKVTSLRTGKSTNVKLIDRGPALGGHRIDLSRKAAREIGLTRKEGTVPVKIKITRTPDGREAPPAR